MSYFVNKIKNNRYIIGIIKLVLSVCVLIVIGQALLINGLDPFYNYKDYNYQNDFSEKESEILTYEKNISQTFLAKGNILHSIYVYFGNITGEEIDVIISNQSGNVVVKDVIRTSEYVNYTWNKIELNSIKLKKGETYTISFLCESGLSALYYSQGTAPIIFGNCYNNENILNGNLVIGFQFIYRYFTKGSIFELILKVVFLLFMSSILCYTVCKIEDILKIFKNIPQKRGFSLSLYFSVSLVLLYNPLDAIRNDVTEFSRVIGSGLAANVDVLRRINNFKYWFIFFAIAFVLFYLFFNYFLYIQKSDEAKKVESFINHFMILANCNLILRCITYFNDKKVMSYIYYFSDYVIMLVSIVIIVYIVLNLDRYISSDDFAKLMLMGASLSYPIAIFVALEWGNGRVVLGIMAIMIMLTFILCKIGKAFMLKNSFKSILSAGVMILPLLPFMTSVYIELIHVLNQYSIFVANPAKYYKIAVMLVLLIVIVIAIFTIRKSYKFIKWKKWSFPWFIIGITCLSIQIPISSIYKPDLFESANYSILVTDFLNYGTIPIVEHYGGHMMTSVWEGIIYGLINNDYLGAAVSPYSALLTPILAVLFYYLVSKIWNENMALFIVLFFPFYEFWSYFGLGMLICLAAMSYVRKNSYFRAIILWAVFIWCTIYRLDLGFAFGLSVIISLAIYIIIEKNWRAIKELGLTLIGWGIICGLIWFIICFAKDINPVNRLIEFLMISLSNQNWAYEGIGNTENTLFSWSYIIIPFLMVICLLYTVFSKKMKEKLGKEKWILLMIFGWSYFENFSRGLVRHSIVELYTSVVLWCAYIFLAVFLSYYKNNKKLFLPVFMGFILCNTLFIQDNNYTAVSIADNAVSAPESIIESWSLDRFSKEENDWARLLQDKFTADGDTIPNFMTYWEQIQCNQEVVERVKIEENLKNYIEEYEDILKILLDNDETFIDFINKTFIYSIIGKKNPAYVSQSPLQLSGEFTQKEFIKQIEGVPIILMPIDSDNNGFSNSLDGITNVYRNYKVAEYIYQNYVPLCKYKSDYAVWCIKERYNEYKEKLSDKIKSFDYLERLKMSDKIGFENVALRNEDDGSITLSYTGQDPIVAELQNVFDLSAYFGKNMKLTIEYATDIPGIMQLFYTTDLGEDYTGDKVFSVNIENNGIAEFVVPISQYSRLRLDIPEKSIVNIKSLTISSIVEYIDYGYDGPMVNIDRNGNVIYHYISAFHNYSISQLPRIWAESDKKNSNNNKVVTELFNKNGIYVFPLENFISGKNGNYLKISAIYDGIDTGKLYDNDDEQADVTVILGYYNDNQFIEKCRYNMNFKEGKHDYLLRCSTDYYWYLRKINAVKIQTDVILHNVEMQILEGD